MQRARSLRTVTALAGVALLSFSATALAQEVEDDGVGPATPGQGIEWGTSNVPPPEDATISLSHDVVHPGQIIEVVVTGCAPARALPPGTPVAGLAPGSATVAIGPPGEFLAEGPLVEDDGSVRQSVQIPPDILNWMDPARRTELYGFEPGEFEILVSCIRPSESETVSYSQSVPLLVVGEEPPRDATPPAGEPHEADPLFTG